MKSIRDKPIKSIKKTVKQINITERNIEIARERGLTNNELLEYDVVPSSMLFDDDGMMTKPNKSLLLKELESYLTPDDYSYSHCSNASFIVDVMANIRKVNLAKLSSFGDLMDNFISFSDIYRQFGRCDYVFDIYSEEPSVKDSERKRRSDVVPIEYSSINPRLPLPKDMKMFWPSKKNKLLLEKLVYQHLSSTAFHGPYPIVLGQVSQVEKKWECIMFKQGEKHVLEHLQSEYEEADLRIPLHVLDALKTGHKICVVVSNDTDVVVGLLYHMPTFVHHNIEELWVKAGIGDTTRYVPLHTIFKCIGKDLSAVLPAVHSLTGCDITSKIGTKKSALKAEPKKYLKCFGISPILSQIVLQDAELYLVKVLKLNSEAKNVVELRDEIFHHSKVSSHQNLPPTTQGLLPHIKCALFNAYTIMHVMDAGNMAIWPLNFGFKFEVDSEMLIPEMSWKTLASHWSIVCSCSKCIRSTCPCRVAAVRCVKFCQCKKVNPSSCKNPTL